MSSSNPYTGLAPKHFWKTAVKDDPGTYEAIHVPKFKIARDDCLVSFGSCFAQRLSQALAASRFCWTDFEPAPPLLPADVARTFGYGVYSARVENIYTIASLHQWLRWAFYPDQADYTYWTHESGRVLDPLRPFVEPDGFRSEAEFLSARERTFAALRAAVKQADVFIFTLGLTETWFHVGRDLVYSMCPGTQAGIFDPIKHRLENLSFSRNQDELESVLDILFCENPLIKVILTVSPIPLVATAVPNSHALVSNTYTKSVLRAVAGEAAARHDNVDYFPAYEMIGQGPNFARFFAPNIRSVTVEGVGLVMKQFLRAYADEDLFDAELETNAVPMTDNDVVCAEMILDVYNEL